jgi:hypothetical protein
VDELNDYPIYRGQLAAQNFKTAYQEIALPALRQIARLGKLELINNDASCNKQVVHIATK